MRGQLRRQDVVVAPARDQKGRAFREARRTGFLSLPARNLTEFPPEAYHLEEHMEKDEKKWECVDLLKIDMSHNAIPSLSDEIAGLTTLISFKLCQNSLQTLPEGFFQLTSLTYLDLSNNALQKDLSESFGALLHLKELALAGNKLRQLPEAIHQLVHLEALRIEENMLIKLPEHIGNLKKLHTLTAHTNQLEVLPTSFAGLCNLQTLDLKKNRLESTTNCLVTLRKLKFVDLRNNKLAVFPILPECDTLDQVFLGYNSLSNINEESILHVKDSITVLEIRDNKLSTLPANLACLYRLKTLDLSNNDLSDLPPGLGYLKNLNHIVVDGNPLRAIRRSIVSAGCESLKKYLRTRGSPPTGVDVLEEEIDELHAQRERERFAKTAKGASGLTTKNSSDEFGYVFRDAASSGTLDISDKCLPILPAALLDNGNTNSYNFASTLLHINISKNGLANLPPEMGELSALVTVTAEENSLRSIDPAIAALPRLQLLRVRKNLLTAEAINEFLGPSAMLNESLKELDLRNNHLTQMPLQIRYLRVLDTLLLSFNKIETLEHFPWHELEKTTVISVCDNKLRSLGRIYDVPLLASLSFENNSISVIPCELGLCPHLRAIYMNGNPQKTVRGAVIAKGSQEILAYLKNKLPLNAVLSPPSPVSIVKTPVIANKASDSNDTQVHVPKSATRKSALNMYASHGDTTRSSSSYLDQERPNTKESAVVAPLDRFMMNKSHPELHNSGATDTNDHSKLENLTNQIQQLELDLDNHGLSAAKKYAMKKELAMLRSAKIREERKLK